MQQTIWKRLMWLVILWGGSVLAARARAGRALVESSFMSLNSVGMAAPVVCRRGQGLTAWTCRA